MISVTVFPMKHANRSIVARGGDLIIFRIVSDRLHTNCWKHDPREYFLENVLYAGEFSLFANQNDCTDGWFLWLVGQQLPSAGAKDDPVCDPADGGDWPPSTSVVLQDLTTRSVLEVPYSD